MDKNFRATFILCPNCGSNERFLESLAQELKDRGLADREWSFSFDARQGVVVDQERARQGRIPIGSELPGFAIRTDICMKCGTIYAVELIRLQGKTGLSPTQLPPPNRAARRRIEKKGGGFFNNPATS